MSASNSPTIEELTKELELTRNELTKFEKKVADLTEERNKVETERNSLKEEVRKLKQNLDHITSLNSTYYNEAQAHLDKVVQLRKELKSMTFLNNSNVNAVKESAERVGELTDERRSLAETVSRLEKQLAGTKETVNVLTAANDAINQDNHELRVENDRLRTVNQESGKLLLLGYEALANAMFKIK